MVCTTRPVIFGALMTDGPNNHDPAPDEIELERYDGNRLLLLLRDGAVTRESAGVDSWDGAHEERVPGSEPTETTTVTMADGTVIEAPCYPVRRVGTLAVDDL